MELERTADEYRAVDRDKNAVTVTTDDWVEAWSVASRATPPDDGLETPVSTESDLSTVVTGDPPESPAETPLTAPAVGPDTLGAAVAGTARSLTFPSVFVGVHDLGTGESSDFGDSSGRVSLPEGSYLLRVASNVRVFVRFDGSARLVDHGDELTVQFPRAQPVVFGFDSLVDTPDTTVRVPETPAGVATALTVASANTTERSPDRSWPTQRTRSPSILVGEASSVPESVRERRPDTGVKLVVPPSLPTLLSAGSLAYYLGAEVTTEVDAVPQLHLAGADGRTVRLPSFPEFQREAANLLERVFYLDCVARGAGPHGGGLAVSDTFETLGLDAERLYHAPLAERVASYLDAPFEEVADRFPEWHLGMHVAPEYEYVETLPHLLANLPHVFRAESEPLSKDRFLSLTFADGFSESPGDLAVADGEPTYRVRRDVSQVDLVAPTLAPARTHGWLADDVPIDVFKSFPEAYENRLDYLAESDGPLSVVAVVNERNRTLMRSDDTAEGMRDEHEAAVAHYERRAPALDVDLRVEENVTTAQLARIFESRNELVHYIGHRDDRGLECTDGYFDATTLAESNTQTFFLNACGSYPEGKRLIRRGSVAGAITFERVPDEQAATVGTAFARMLMGGFCIERALTKARKQLMTAKDYAVVGDGTHVVTQNDALVPPDVWLFDGDGDERAVHLRQQSPRVTGGRVKGHFDSSYRVWGEGAQYAVDNDDLEEYLDILESPVVYDDSLLWPEELRERVLG